jgi:hypothetical protein
MGYEFTAERAPTYLHVTGSGEHTADNLRRFMRDTYRAAIEHDCDALLMELNFTGRSLDLVSIYSVITERSAEGSRLKHIACVNRNAEHSDERADFAELAANRLGVNVRFFRSLEDARRYL